MGALNVLVLVCVLYVAVLFGVAFIADRLAARSGGGAWLKSPLIYTLSLSIYCTAWTFYGAVGFAARSGLEFVTIYLGPTLVMIAWWWGLRHLVRVGRNQRATSIADLLSARYGKSNLLAAGVTILAFIAITPYIALQLQSITLSFAAFTASDAEAGLSDSAASALWVAIGLAVFAIIFGTRNLDANERHHGVVMAIAVEAVVKLVSLLCVGVFVVWGLSGGLANTLVLIDESEIGAWSMDGSRWMTLTFLAGTAFICLPRMFQVMVVENEDEEHLRTASWAFPLYLMLMSLFVVPIAVVGLNFMPEGANPDLFVLTLPLAAGQDGLAVLAFLGGFSSATSMAIVSAIALSIMMSNHLVMPIWLSSKTVAASMSGDVRQTVLLARRISIAAIMACGYLYYSFTGGGALAAIGLTAFAGIVQILPALIGGLFWRGATRSGAFAGLTVGFTIWVYTLLLPAVIGQDTFGQSVAWIAPGWLAPHALFGISGMDPLVHSVFWSMSLNTFAFWIVSLWAKPGALEKVQSARFLNLTARSDNVPGTWGTQAQSEDLMIMTQRILGAADAQAFFQRESARQGGRGHLPDPTPAFLERLERQLSGSVGSATAHAMLSQLVGQRAVSVEDLIAVADETAQRLEYSSRLESQSAELGRTAEKLRRANAQLTEISEQKDAFLSQVSHELRTPMTSIRAFSEILRDTSDLAPEDKTRYASIIHNEALRLTRLLDDLLDLSVLENGQVNLNFREARLHDVLDHAVSTASTGQDKPIVINRRRLTEAVTLTTDADRLAQVFINLIANAQKYCDADTPELTISVAVEDGRIAVDFIDNGSGIPLSAQSLVFEKFARVSPDRAGGAGLGLAICKEVMQRLRGSIEFLPGQSGAAFRVSLPVAVELAAQ